MMGIAGMIVSFVSMKLVGLAKTAGTEPPPARSRNLRRRSRQTLASRRALAALGANQAGQPQGDQDDESVGGIDPERLDLRKDQDVLHQRQQDDAGESADHTPAPAVERDPSNDGSRKDLEDEVVALGGCD